MKVKKIVKILVCVLVIFFFIRLGAYMISPGSDSRAEYYRVNIPTSQIIPKITELKERYPDYKVYDLDQRGDSVEYIDKDPNSFFVYLPSVNCTAVCIIRQLNNEHLIGLKGVFTHPNLRGFEGLNNGELSREKNQKIKKSFETGVLNRIGTWERVDTGNSFFGLYF